MMETWDAIRARRNVRKYEDRPIEHDDLERILEAARRTPSSMNEQPWDFVLCTERATLQRLAETWRYADTSQDLPRRSSSWHRCPPTRTRGIGSSTTWGRRR